MKVIDVHCSKKEGFGSSRRITTIVSKDLQSRVHQVERLHGVKFECIIVENARMRFIFTDVRGESFADTRQTILSRSNR